jgi:DnaJ-class molecular chaperone
MVGSWFSSCLSSKNHYDTLNVKRDASVEEIKARFRKLSLETHPDLAASQNNNNHDNNTTSCERTQDALKRENAERFKQISHAASILTSKTKREMYDLELELQRFTPNVLNEPRGSSLFHARPPRPRVKNGQQQTATTGFQIFLEQVFRPRNMILGSVAIYAFVSYFSANNINNKQRRMLMERQPGVAERVEAWKNPQTGQWEQPAPWDPVYRNLKPKLELVPREQVRSRTR